jgi:hypothetical protein
MTDVAPLFCFDFDPSIGRQYTAISAGRAMTARCGIATL